MFLAILHHFVFHPPMPPAKVLHAMQAGHSCWLEISYRISHGTVTASSSEWLCR